MHKLTQQLDDIYQTAIPLREHARSFHAALQELCAQAILHLNPYPIERELEAAQKNLLDWFRGKIHGALSEGRQIKFPEDFLERALGIERGHQKDLIWTKWDADKVLALRDQLFPDLRKAEWQQSLQIAVRTIGMALQRHDNGRIDRWKRRTDKADELQVSCCLYERDVCRPALLRTSYRLDVENLHRTIQVVEGIFDGSRHLANVAIPLILNPDRSANFEPRSVYRWHDTHNAGIPRVRVMADHGIIFRFASPDFLQRTKDIILPLLEQ